jgi:cyanoexosortase B-associated protein
MTYGFPHYRWLPQRWIRIGLVVMLSGLVGIGILPAYSNGQWPWVNAPQVDQAALFQPVVAQGFALPGWTLTTHQTMTINQQDWTLSEYVRSAGSPASDDGPSPLVDQIALLMRPQTQTADQPGLEWLNLDNNQNLSRSFQRQVALEVVPQPTVIARARLSQGRNQQQTFTTLQWYAWPTGGHPSPGVWFWHDQWAQLTRRTRLPWIALALFIPMDPLGDVADYQPLAVDIGREIQRQIFEPV